ncbi:MAG: hypothetical protein LUH22_01930 [Bacteroides sp.]|nr:hypothetical protein [Bacteroides sp.]
MVQNILKQIWNKRRSNGWILVELILVTYFMWIVIDPVYVLLSNRAIPQRYDIQNVFRLNMAEYAENHSKYNEAFATDSLRKISFLHIYQLVKQYPGIEAAVVTLDSQYPLSPSTNSTTMQYDTLKAGALQMNYYKDGEFFKVFRIKDISSGEIPDSRNELDRVVYLADNLSGKLFPEENAINKNVFRKRKNDSIYYRVAGIVSNFKFRSTEQPYAAAFYPSIFKLEDLPWGAQICFRIRDDVSKAAFIEKFKQELAPQLAIGNLYFLQLTDFEMILKKSEFS